MEGYKLGFSFPEHSPPVSVDANPFFIDGYQRTSRELTENLLWVCCTFKVSVLRRLLPTPTQVSNQATHRDKSPHSPLRYYVETLHPNVYHSYTAYQQT